MRHGLEVGKNVDPISVDAGLKTLAEMGYSDFKTRTVIGYALVRWSKGEEEAALRGAIDRNFHGIPLTCWYRVLASARAAAEAPLSTQPHTK